MIRFCSHKRFQEQLKIRPAQYRDEIAALIVKQDERGFYIDDENPAYQSLMQKYSSARNAESSTSRQTLEQREKQLARRKLVEHRQSICKSCEWFPKQCEVFKGVPGDSCGCGHRARMADESETCPLNKWPQIEVQSINPTGEKS